MLRALPYIGLGLLLYIGFAFAQIFRPEEMNSLIVKLDVFGLTAASRYEHARQDKIMRLEQDAYGMPIGSLEKTVLLNHTVFINASAQMVEYALGAPKIPFKARNSRKMIYVYFLANDKWPTVFEFKCVRNTDECNGDAGEVNKNLYALVKAYKESKIDVDNLILEETAAAQGAKK